MGSKLLDLVAVAVIAICGNAVLANAQVTVWASVTAGPAAVARVSTTLVSVNVTKSATGTAGVTLRDGQVTGDGTLLTVTATSNNTLTYDLDTASKATFDITGVPGVIKVKAGVTIFHSAISSYTVIVTATDATASDSGVLTLTVTVNGMPTFSATPNCLNIADATASGTTLYTYTIADPENTTVTTTIATGNTNSYFTSTITAGQLVTAKKMAKVTDASFTLGIKAVDAGTPPSTASTTVTVNVLDAGTDMGPCPGGTIAKCSVITTLTLLIAYYF